MPAIQPIYSGITTGLPASAAISISASTPAPSRTAPAAKRALLSPIDHCGADAWAAPSSLGFSHG